MSKVKKKTPKKNLKLATSSVPPRSSTASFDWPRSFWDAPPTTDYTFDFKQKPPKLVSVVPSQIYLIENLFSPSLCKDLLNKFNDLSMVTTPLIKSKDYAPRVNDRVLMTDNKATDTLWRILKPALEEVDEDCFIRASGLNPNLRIYRYTKGHYFGKHYDDSVDVVIDGKKKQTKWTLLVYLSGGSGDDLEGGATIFYLPISRSEPVKVKPIKGMALLHKHGDDCFLHEGELVRNGVKWILRSDIVY